MTVPPEWTISDKVYTTQDEVHQMLADREAVKLDPTETLIQEEITLFLRETAIERLTAKGLLTGKEA